MTHLADFDRPRGSYNVNQAAIYPFATVRPSVGWTAQADPFRDVRLDA
jgi:hypothetical protein